MIESPVMDEVIEILRKKYEAEAIAKVTVQTLRENVVANLEARFGSIPTNRVVTLSTITDESRLRALLRLAATCPDIEAFVADLEAGK